MTSMIELMERVVDKLEAAVLKNNLGTAVVHIDTERPLIMSDDTYWATKDTATHFEARAARRVVGHAATRWVFGTTIIIEDGEDAVRMRPPNPHFPPRQGEEEVLWLVAVDLDEGIDIARVDVTRDGGIPTFGELLMAHGRTQLLHGAPGFEIVRTVSAQSP